MPGSDDLLLPYSWLCATSFAFWSGRPDDPDPGSMADPHLLIARPTISFPVHNDSFTRDPVP